MTEITRNEKKKTWNVFWDGKWIMETKDLAEAQDALCRALEPEEPERGGDEDWRPEDYI